MGLPWRHRRDRGGRLLRVNDFLANDGLTKGNVIIAGIPKVYDDLVRLSKL